MSILIGVWGKRKVMCAALCQETKLQELSYLKASP